MIYLFIDESGDIGNPEVLGNSRDFSLACCIGYIENIDYLSHEIQKMKLRLKKKEIKFPRLSSKEIILMHQFLKKLEVEKFSVYSTKTKINYGPLFLKGVIFELMVLISIRKNEKIKVFIDGPDNAYYRKIYEPIIKKKFPRAVVKFANSMKTPMIQVADFYAGHRRKEG